MHLESRKLAPGTVNLPLGAVRIRRVNRLGRTWGDRMTEKVAWHVLREFAAKAVIEKLPSSPSNTLH
jgi:hypothetical protein